MLGGAGLAAGISVGALLAEEMLGSQLFTGLPAGLFTLGSAFAAFLVGQSTQRFGRRVGLAWGFLAGGFGAAGVVLAAGTGSVWLLFASLFVYGAGTATNLQARYAGADLALPSRRGFGTSMAMVATTIGAVAGPNHVEPLGTLATGLGLPALAGPFLLAAVAYSSAGIVLFVWLRPDPLRVAQALAAAPVTAPDASAIPRVGVAAYAGAIVMVVSQLVMVAVMTVTPIHMRDHDHGLGAVGFVIGLHIAAMWLPSLFTGVLVDRIGRTPMIYAAAVTLLASGVIAAFAPGDSVALITVALVLLGLGWNFLLVAGTALVVDGTVLANRAKTQGNIDILIALSGATGGLLSGVMLGATSFQTLSLVSAFVSLMVLAALKVARQQ